MNEGAYCNLEPLGTYFNNKPLYKCSYCNLTVGLDDPNTRILCFKKMQDVSSQIHALHTNQDSDIGLVDNKSLDDNISDHLIEQARNRQKIIETQQHNVENDNTICSAEQIDQRLAICKTCEYFQNNSCLLCGCTVVREINHKNKLAHKDQKCPAGKWDIIPN